MASHSVGPAEKRTPSESEREFPRVVNLAADVSPKTTLHTPETLRVFVSELPPEEERIGESRGQKMRVWRVVTTSKIARKYEKAGALLAKRRLSRITRCGQFPNQTEKL